MLALVTVDKSTDFNMHPRNWILSLFSPLPDPFPSLSQPSSKPGFGLRAERRCGEIRNMDLRTLGDIDGYERSRGGKTPFLKCHRVTRWESWLGMHVCIYIYSAAMSHVTISQWVFFSFRLIIKSYSCGLAHARAESGTGCVMTRGEFIRWPCNPLLRTPLSMTCTVCRNPELIPTRFPDAKCQRKIRRGCLY